MKRGFNKRGQFYLVTVVVIAALIMGISVVSNYSKKEVSPGIEELRDEIKIEGAKTMGYGISSGFSNAQMKTLMQNFTRYYVLYEGREKKDIYFLFGESTNMTVSGYQGTNKVVIISSGVSQNVVTQSSGNFTGSVATNGSMIVLSIDGKPNSFPIKPAQNFYFVVAQDVGGAEYIITG